MKCVVLAAGKGIRMQPLTDSRPKAMVELCGKPLLQWHLEAMARAGASEIAIVVGHLHTQIEKFFGNEFQGSPITYLLQEQQLGTAHAISLAKEFANQSNFLVSYCDVLMESSFIRNFFGFGEKNRQMFDAVIAVRKVQDVSRFGLIETSGERVKAIIEKPKEKKPGLINAGLWWFYPKIFFEIEKTGKSMRGEFEITDSVKGFMKKSRLGCMEVQGKCLDIGTIEELKKAELGLIVKDKNIRMNL